MTSPVSRPVYPGTTSHGAAYKQVQVISVNPTTYHANVVDQFGKQMDVRYDIIRAKGNPPAPGETWLIDRMYGFWTFGAIMNGGLGGVVIPPDNVTGLNATLDDHQTQITQQTNATTGQIATKGDILAGTGPGIVTRQPPGSDGAVPVYASLSPTGIVTRVPMALTAPLTGATNPSRYVGGTLSGAPTSGTFQSGDTVFGQNGNIWTCTAGGTPGTWAQTAPGNQTVTGGKLVQNSGGNPLLASSVTGSGLMLSSAGVLAVDGTGTNFTQFRADSMLLMGANNALLGNSGGNASYLSPADGAGFKFASGVMLVTSGDGSLFNTIKANVMMAVAGNNVTLTGAGGNGAVLSLADGAGVKFGSSVTQIVNGDGTLFQKLKAYDLTISSANNAFIGLNGPNAIFVSPTSGDNCGVKLGSGIVQIVDGTGSAWASAKGISFQNVPSSEQLKREIRVLKPHELGESSFTDIIKKVRAKRYKYSFELDRGSGGPNGDLNEDHIGFIAEDLHAAHPDLVRGDFADPYSVGIFTMSLIAVLWEMNKELVDRIERLEGKPVDSSGSGTK